MVNSTGGVDRSIACSGEQVFLLLRGDNIRKSKETLFAFVCHFLNGHLLSHCSDQTGQLTKDIFYFVLLLSISTDKFDSSLSLYSYFNFFCLF